MCTTLLMYSRFCCTGVSKTLQCIVEVQGSYIEDSSKKIEQSGYRTVAAAEYKREIIPVDASALATFHKMVANMNSGGGVSFVFDNNEEAGSNNTLTRVLVPDDEDFDGTSDDNNNEEDKEE